MSSPAIVLLSKYVFPSEKGFDDYVNYIDREDAKENIEVVKEEKKEDTFNLYYSYADYMGDEEKQGELFTNDKNSLSADEKKKLKNDYKQAGENGSPLWQDVFSFDNYWLEKEGMLVDGVLDEALIRNAVRKAMNKLIEKEEMSESTVWSASVHYNTDNIHVHMATVELDPTRGGRRNKSLVVERKEMHYRGRRKPKTLEFMKSEMVNHLVDRSEMRLEMNRIIRGSVEKKKDTELVYDEKMAFLFEKAIENMPENLGHWQYDRVIVNDARPFIDKISEMYLEKYHKDDMEALDKMLDKEVELDEELYGKRKDLNIKNYKENQLDDLKKRMGNAVIKEMMAYKKRMDMPFNRRVASTEFKKRFWNGRKFGNGQMHYSLIRLRTAMNMAVRDAKTRKNIAEHEQMLEEGVER